MTMNAPSRFPRANFCSYAFYGRQRSLDISETKRDRMQPGKSQPATAETQGKESEIESEIDIFQSTSERDECLPD